ncbi:MULTISPECIES: glycosyltransferase [Halococcus]|uniref:Glycosyltransferase n=1 Tax=Halococcus salifodinae DSM 8989 TaxID=1227456 RepID=M0MY94_9EURY|nr:MULTISPECIES: glycosyltransferase [Halococcus]EMA49824.1 glycosyltransferase [Halococcus salifodinae DSM 8989]
MQLSVVVPTLNGRTQLVACLDALATAAPESEVVVVNGPSADGTTGMVRERDDVDVLVEIADRNLNVARNAGIEHASGEWIALVGHDRTVEPGWYDAVTAGLDPGAARAGAHVFAEGYPMPGGRERVGAVTGPTGVDGERSDGPESRAIAGREVTYVDGRNVAFSRAALDALDGFDEYLQTGGARDLAHRLAANGYAVDWQDDMCVRDAAAVGPTRPGAAGSPVISDGGRTERDWYWKYRALAYRLVKNYGVRPTTARRLANHAVRDAFSGFVGVARGDGTPTAWFGNGRDVLTGSGRGEGAGLLARWRDRDRRNPNGISSRSDRAVAVYDRR